MCCTYTTRSSCFTNPNSCLEALRSKKLNVKHPWTPPGATRHQHAKKIHKRRADVVGLSLDGSSSSMAWHGMAWHGCTHVHEFGSNLRETSQKGFNGIIDPFFDLDFIGNTSIGKVESFQINVLRCHWPRRSNEQNRMENALKSFSYLSRRQF